MTNIFQKISRNTLCAAGAIVILCASATPADAQNIQRFEYFSSKEGLSQNSVYSLMCDRMGFLWIGTMNGLNRYDGRNFKVYKGLSTDNVASNNRVERIWEDRAGFIWIESYDGCYQYFDPRTETFGTMPVQSDNTIESATAYAQYSDSVIFVGAESSGVYCMKLVDGQYQVTNFSPMADGENTKVTALLTGSQHRLWILTTNGLAMLTRQQIENNDFKPEILHGGTQFTEAVAESDGYIFFGLKDGGMTALNIASNKFEQPASWAMLTQRSVVIIKALPDGRVALATSDGRAFAADPNTKSILEIKHHGGEVLDFYVDKYRQLWIATRQPGLTRYDIATTETQYYQIVPTEISASVDLERPFFYEDNDNNFWVGTHGGGLLWYNRIDDKFDAYLNNINDTYSIPSNIVHCIVQDQSGQLWLGTGQYRGGLVKVIAENKAFRSTVPNKNIKSQSSNVVRAIFEDSAQNLWVSSKSGDLFVYDEMGTLRRTFGALPCDNGRKISSVVYDIHTDRDGFLWLATKGAGVFVSTKKVNFNNIAKDNITFANYNHDAESDNVGVSTRLSHNNAYSIVQDGFGNIWVATFGNGLNRIKRNKNGVEITWFNKSNTNLLSNKVRYLYIDADNNLWAATTLGVCRAEGSTLNSDKITFEQFTHSANANSLSYNDVCHIYQDSRNTMYFATIGGGLCTLDTDKDGNRTYNVYDTYNGLCNNAVYSIVEDNGGNLWMSTENGISRIDGKKKNIETFNSNTGLPFNSFSESTCTKLHNGKIAFGGYMGYVVVSPLQLASSPYKGELALTSFQIDNKELPIGNESPLKQSITYTDAIEISTDQSNISIEFCSLDMLDPDNARYAYKLDGLDTEWNYVGKQNRAVYTNLQPGKYTFKVRHTYRNGEWSDNVKQLEITVNALWWQTTTAYVIYALILMLAIYLAIIALLRIRQYRQKLDVETKVNEIKLQFFTNIAHEIRTPLTLIVSPIDTLINSDLPQEAHNQLMIIKRNSSRLLQLVNQLLDFRKVQNKKMYLKLSEINPTALVAKVGDSFKLLAEHKHINYNIEYQPDMKNIWVDTQTMDTVVYNLLSNAMKFTEANKNVTLTVSQDDDYTYIKVQDEGRGIKTTDPDQLFRRYTILSTNDLSGTGIGLSLAYEFVNLHKGQLLVESAQGKGSTFTIKLHNGVAHFEGDKMVSFNQSPAVAETKNLRPDDTAQQLESVVTTDATDSNANNLKKMLIVEDNHEILEYLASTLQSKFNCFKATNGQEALVIANSQEPDIIITDLMMPVMNGMEMIKALKDNVATSHIPIIALTADTTTETEIETYKMGIDAFIAKPFSVEHIKAVVDNILTKRENMIAQMTGIKSGNAKTQNHLEDHEVNINILSKDEEFVKNLVKFAEENYKADLSIDHFASHFNMSRTVFYNKVKSLTGQSPLEFVRQIKFKIAEQLLRKGYNVSEVAFEIGYSDIKYFSKQFRAQFGHSPSQIKKNKKEEQNNDDSSSEE